jgi:hypothetical protein
MTDRFAAHQHGQAAAIRAGVGRPGSVRAAISHSEFPGRTRTWSEWEAGGCVER